MKKLLSFATAAVAVFSLSGCAALLNSISTTPSFSVFGDGSSDGIYDGQTFRITKTGTCTYAWASSDPKQLVLTQEGTSAYVTGKLTNPDATYYGKITATNANDATVAPVEKEVPVYAWVLKIYDAAGNEVKSPNALAKNNTYVIKMARKTGTSSFTPVTKLLKGMRISSTEETESLAFSGLASSWKTVSTTPVTMTITTPNSFSACVVSAKLGNVSHSISLRTAK